MNEKYSDWPYEILAPTGEVEHIELPTWTQPEPLVDGDRSNPYLPSGLRGPARYYEPMYRAWNHEHRDDTFIKISARVSFSKGAFPPRLFLSIGQREFRNGGWSDAPLSVGRNRFEGPPSDAFTEIIHYRRPAVPQIPREYLRFWYSVGAIGEYFENNQWKPSSGISVVQLPNTPNSNQQNYVFHLYHKVVNEADPDYTVTMTIDMGHSVPITNWPVGN